MLLVVACADGGDFVTQPAAIAPLAAQGNGDTPVTSYVADSDTTISPSLQLRSDGAGAYRNANTLSSVVQSIGAWVLDSKNLRNSTRRVFLDLGQPIAGSGPNAGAPIAVPAALYQVRIISKCNLYGASMWTIAPGATTVCPVHVAFDYSGSAYAVQMNPNPAGDPEGAPETQPANITCTTPSSGAGPCTAWTITPSGTYIAADGSTKYRNVVRLIKYVTSKGNTQNVNQGDFYFSFTMRVTNP